MNDKSAITSKRCFAFYKLAFQALILLMMISGSGCKSAPKSETPKIGNAPMAPSTSAGVTVIPTAPPIEIRQPKGFTDHSPLIARPLTSQGDNTDARLSPDGTKLIFVSRVRAPHKQGQVYELDLTRAIERRLTFNDGEASNPLWMENLSSFAYASSTDEIKEESVAVDRLMRKHLPDRAKKKVENTAFAQTEIYLQSVNGREINRITDSQGFDGEADRDVKGRRLIFVSARSGAPNLYLTSLTAAGQNFVRLTDGEFLDRSPRFSFNGHWVTWTRQEPQANASSLMIASAIANDFGSAGNGRRSSFKTAIALTSQEGMIVHPSWHPSEELILFSSNRDGGAFNLFIIDRAGNCLKKLTEVEFDLLQPSFSHDGKQIIFTSNKSGTNQIYRMDFRSPTSCLNSQPQSGAPSAGAEATPQSSPPSATKLSSHPSP